MLYFDTSILTPLVLSEATSGAVETFISALPPGKRATSEWARVEFASVVAKHVRMRNMSEDAAHAVIARFEDVVARSFTLFLPRVEDFSLATQFLGNFDTGLRGGDALHLAIAVGNAARIVYTLDKPMLKACRALEIDGRAGIDWPGYN